MNKVINGLCIVAVSAILWSCSITQGSIVPSTHYVYPNSNVTPLGSTNAEVNKFGIIFPPGFKAKDLDKLYGDALSKHVGTDLILDCKVDSKNTMFFIFHFMKVTVSGTAAKMEVGKQDIGQNDFRPINDQTNNNNSERSQQQVIQDPVQGQNIESSQGQRESMRQEPERIKEPEQPKEPLPPARFGVQLNNIESTLVNSGLGISIEFFFSKKSSLATTFNYFTPRRADAGYGNGTYEVSQISAAADMHTYLVNKVIGLYLLSGFSYEKYKYAKAESAFSTNIGYGELGVQGGLGLSASLFSKKLTPFGEFRYYKMAARPAFIDPNLNTDGTRISFGAKYSFTSK